MLRLELAEIKFINENIANGKELIEMEQFEDLLLALDSWILANGFDANYALTDEGREIQRMYDNIFYNN